ncbi:uncharacterized protein LOC125470846, partial [Pyrus x bretschneideri]|uniref:uncharacterized protein LOC125470846 n=1 Tax=Pyrus x bretschneideri TaxID=225117 RepID=UPI00202E9B01
KDRSQNEPAYPDRISVRFSRPSNREAGLLDLEPFEGFLVGPSLDGEIGLSVEADAEDDDGEEAGDVAGELPVLPFTRLTWGERGPIEEVAFGSFLVARAGPPARTGG